VRSVEIDPIGERIEAVRQAASAQALLDATCALAASDHGNGVNNEAIACLVEVLGFNNPGAAVAAVDGLIALGPEAVEPEESKSASAAPCGAREGPWARP
jgi:phycocyanobilin lyase beta subunit